MIDLLFIALFQTVAGDPTQPVAEAPTAQAPAEAEQGEEEVNVRGRRARCREEAVTGSRLSRRQCITDREAEVLRDQAQEQFRNKRYIPIAGPEGSATGAQ